MSLPFEQLIRAADAVHLRLERLYGVALWEASPGFYHQLEVKRIERSLRPLGQAVTCLAVSSVLFAFPNDSFTCPDIAVLETLPEPREMEDALTMIPAAVIEIISKNYEYKDLVLGPPFYLENGIKDVVVFDPRSKLVLHHRREWCEPREMQSPVRIELECGCEVTV